MEILETKTPEFGSTSEKPAEDKKDSKSSAKSEKKAPSQLFADKKDRPSLFENDKSKSKGANPYDWFEQKADKNPPLEKLSRDEQTLVVDDQTSENLAAANAELIGTEPQTPAEAAAIAGATFNEAVRERIENGQPPTPDTLDNAMNDTAEILGLEPADIEEGEPDVPESDFEAESPEISELDNGDDIPEEVGEEESSNDEIPETHETPNGLGDAAAEDLDDDPIVAAPPATPTALAVNPAMPGVPGGPPGPTPPGGGPGGPAGPGGPPSPGFGPGGFNMNPGPGVNAAANLAAAPWLNPNVAAGLAANRLASSDRRHSHLPYVLVGGVVGYLIGRRRGRINTEKKLLPVQQKLENQVGDLQYQVAAREAKIRKLAYEKAISHPHIFVDLPQRLRELQELQKLSLKKEHFTEAGKEVAKTAERRAAKEVAAIAVSAELLHKVNDMTERSEKPRAEKPPTGASPAERPKRAKDMAMADLLAVAAQIPVEDRDLRQLHKSGRIDELGVRRVVEAYLRGERYDKVLHENMKTNNTMESLPLVDESTIAVTGSIVTDLPDDLPLTQVLQDPQFASTRQEYYETLSFDESKLDDGHSGRWIVIVAVGVAVGVTLFMVFR